METLDKLKETILLVSSDELDINQLLIILQLTVSKLDINTVSETARTEGKSPNGIDGSKRYRKIMIGKQKMVIKGIEDSDMPF